MDVERAADLYAEARTAVCQSECGRTYAIDAFTPGGGLTDLDSPRLLHTCTYPASYCACTFRPFKPDALALLDKSSSGLLLVDGSGSLTSPY